MSDLYIGCDIENISRFRKKLNAKSKKFLDKIFSNKEQIYCDSKSDPAMHYAGKFCAKEAIVKAIKSSNQKISISFNQIEILNSSHGEPIANFNIKIKGFCKISISHTSDYAMSIALFIKK